MAVKKFSQITQSAVNMTAADFMMVVQNGTTDLLYTPTQITAGLNVFTAALQGSVPASGGGTANFMRADGNWAVPPGTAAPGGAVNTIQFNSASTFGGMSGTSWDDTNRSLTMVGATVTANNPILNLSQTWNNGAVTFTGLKLNVTSTASAAASLLLDLQVASSSVLSIRKDGVVIAPDSAIIFPAYTFASAPGLDGWFRNTSSGLSGWIQGGAFPLMAWSYGNGFAFASDMSMGWSNTSLNALAARDLNLWRDAAGILAQRNSTNAQTFRIYNTFTDTSNFEYGGLDWQTTANVLRIRMVPLGTGTARIISVDGFNKAGAPANTDIPAGTYGFLRDTSGNHTYLIYNNAGTIQKIELV